tara:strand:- start:9913 stop:10476 length:564 start_codon:yes stop_codon:yes gene_type:complete
VKAALLYFVFFVITVNCATLSAQWHPVAPQKVQGQEAYLFFYDYFFEAQKAEEVSIFNDSVLLEKLEKYRLSRPTYLLEVYLPQINRYRYYCLRSQADGQEIAVIESNYKQLLKDLIAEDSYQKFLKRSLAAPEIPDGHFYQDQFYFSTQNKIMVEEQRDESWRAKMIERDSILTPFLKVVERDLKD